MRPFPYGAVIILALTLTINAYTLTNLFPYVGVMVKHLLGLTTTNESGERDYESNLKVPLKLVLVSCFTRQVEVQCSSFCRAYDSPPVS